MELGAGMLGHQGGRESICADSGYSSSAMMMIKVGLAKVSYSTTGPSRCSTLNVVYHNPSCCLVSGMHFASKGCCNRGDSALPRHRMQGEDVAACNRQLITDNFTHVSNRLRPCQQQPWRHAGAMFAGDGGSGGGVQARRAPQPAVCGCLQVGPPT